MSQDKMLITLQLSNDEEITRAVTSDIDPERLQDTVVEMYDQLMNKDIPAF